MSRKPTARQPLTTGARIEYPEGLYKRDEPTAGGDAQKTFEPSVDRLFNDVINGGRAKDPNLTHVDFPYTNFECYRNSVLIMLFHLKPFVNFLDVVTNQPNNPMQGVTTSVTLLKDLLEVYYDSNQDPTTRANELNDCLQAWWDHICTTRPPGGSATWNETLSANPGSHGDAEELCSYMFGRMFAGELIGDENALLFRLFRHSLVERRAYLCDCHEKVRQPFNDQGWSLWNIGVQVQQEGMSTLKSLLDARFHDENPRQGTCPTCGAQKAPVHEYQKFQFLPEVLFVPIEFSLQAKRGYVDIPETLDLQEVQDYPPPQPAVEGDDATAVESHKYQLQAMVSYSANIIHYVAHTRQPDGSWDTIDDLNTPVDSNAHRLRMDRGFGPRLLAYTRVRGPENTDSDSIPTPVPTPTPAPVPARALAPAPILAVEAASAPMPILSPVPTQTRQALPDPSTVGEKDMASLFQKHGINKNRKKGQTMHSKYTEFFAKDEDDKLDYLIKPRLVDIAQAEGVDGDHDRAKRDQVIKSIKAHRATTSSTPDPTTPKQTADKPQTPRSRRPSAAEIRAAQDRSIIAGLRFEASGLRARNAKLEQDVAALQQTIRDRDTRIQALGDRVATLETIVSTLSASNQGQTSVAPQNQGQTSAAPQNQGHHPLARPFQAATGQIVWTVPGEHGHPFLKVVTENIYHPDELMRDHIGYISLPSYDHRVPLITSSWIKVHAAHHESETGRFEQHVEADVYVTITDQNDGREVTYTYTIDGGLVRGPLPEPVLDLEIMTEAEEGGNGFFDEGRDLKIVGVTLPKKKQQQKQQPQQQQQGTKRPASIDNVKTKQEREDQDRPKTRKFNDGTAVPVAPAAVPAPTVGDHQSVSGENSPSTDTDTTTTTTTSSSPSSSSSSSSPSSFPSDPGPAVIPETATSDRGLNQILRLPHTQARISPALSTIEEVTDSVVTSSFFSYSIANSGALGVNSSSLPPTYAPSHSPTPSPSISPYGPGPTITIPATLPETPPPSPPGPAPATAIPTNLFFNTTAIQQSPDDDDDPSAPVAAVAAAATPHPRPPTTPTQTPAEPQATQRSRVGTGHDAHEACRLDSPSGRADTTRRVRETPPGPAYHTLPYLELEDLEEMPEEEAQRAWESESGEELDSSDEDGRMFVDGNL